LERDATSKARIATTAKRKNGKRTKNHEIPVYPLLHKKFKNQVQKRTQRIFTMMDMGWNLVKIAMTMEIDAKTKYIMAGVHNLEIDIPFIIILYIYNIFYFLFLLNKIKSI